jgi:hypothetical protein
MDLIRAFSAAISSLQVWLFNSSTWIVSCSMYFEAGDNRRQLFENFVGIHG